VRLQLADRDTTLYGKALHRLRFCIDIPPPPELGGREGPPELEPQRGTQVIASWRCRQVIHVDGTRRLAIAYTDELAIDDPTGAVAQFEGVPGLVLPWEELPRGDRSGWRTRVEVSELSLVPPDPETFALPDGYRRFAGIDAARAEDRRILEAEVEAEHRTAPLSAAEQRMFVGRWRWERGDAELEIAAVGPDDDALRFRTVSPTGARDEVAMQKGRLLLVEEPPNYRLYRLDDAGRRLTLVDDHTFRFHRV